MEGLELSVSTGASSLQISILGYCSSLKMLIDIKTRHENVRKGHTEMFEVELLVLSDIIDQIENSATMWLKSINKKKIKLNEGVTWGQVGMAVMLTSKLLYKSYENRFIRNNLEVAVEYLEASDKSKLAGKHLEISANKKNGDQDADEAEGNNWGWSGVCLLMAAEYMMKSIEYGQCSNRTMVLAHREAAVLAGVAATLYSNNAKFIENKNISLSNASSIGRSASCIMLQCWFECKKHEARYNAQSILAKCYSEAVIDCQHAQDLFEKSAAARTESLSMSWYAAALTVLFSSNFQVRACEAQIEKHYNLMLKYLEAVKVSREAGERLKISADKKMYGHEAEGNSWGWSGVCLLMTAEYMVKAAYSEFINDSTSINGYLIAITHAGKAAAVYADSAIFKSASTAYSVFFGAYRTVRAAASDLSKEARDEVKISLIAAKESDDLYCIH